MFHLHQVFVTKIICGGIRQCSFNDTS